MKVQKYAITLSVSEDDVGDHVGAGVYESNDSFVCIGFVSDYDQETRRGTVTLFVPLDMDEDALRHKGADSIRDEINDEELYEDLCRALENEGSFMSKNFKLKGLMSKYILLLLSN